MICQAILGGDLPVEMESELAKLKRRDPEAVAALIERYQFRLYRYLLRLVRDPATAEDLFQQTWLRVVEKIRRYDASRSFEAWLFSVAHNLTIDHLRKRRLDSLDEPQQTGESAAARLPAGGQDALTSLLEKEKISIVLDKLALLPAAYREVLTLRFEEEMKLEEIAEVTGVPLGTVKSRLRRGLEGLRSRLVVELDTGGIA